MIALELTLRSFPAALITIGFAIAVSFIFSLEQYGVPVVGEFIILQLGSSACLENSYVGPLLRFASP